MFWINISDVPQEIQDMAKEIDGEDYDAYYFGLYLSYDLSNGTFEIATATDPLTGENGNIYYMDNECHRHWFHVEIEDAVVDQMISECGKIREGKTLPQGYEIIDCVRFSDQYGYVLAERPGETPVFSVDLFLTDQANRRAYSRFGCYADGDMARATFAIRIAEYERISGAKLIRPSLAAQLNEAKRQAAAYNGQHEQQRLAAREAR